MNEMLSAEGRGGRRQPQFNFNLGVFMLDIKTFSNIRTMNRSNTSRGNGDNLSFIRHSKL
jgi:hypothetical protein